MVLPINYGDIIVAAVKNVWGYCKKPLFVNYLQIKVNITTSRVSIDIIYGYNR